MRARRSAKTKRPRVSKRPSLNKNRGPGEFPLWTKYPSIAATGHRSEPVAPMTSLIPSANWSHFDRLMWTSIHEGLWILFTRTSPYAKWYRESNPESDGATASPVRRKAKKQRVAAAHSILASALIGWPSHDFLSCWSISGVIGSLVRFGPPASLRRAPLSTYCNWGILTITGSPRPMAICLCLMAAR